MPKITEIIPDDIFNAPDLKWAKVAFEEGNFFNVVVARFRDMREEIRDLDVYLKASIQTIDQLKIKIAELQEASDNTVRILRASTVNEHKKGQDESQP